MQYLEYIYIYIYSTVPESVACYEYVRLCVDDTSHCDSSFYVDDTVTVLIFSVLMTPVNVTALSVLTTRSLS